MQVQHFISYWCFVITIGLDFYLPLFQENKLYMIYFSKNKIKLLANIIGILVFLTRIFMANQNELPKTN